MVNSTNGHQPLKQKEDHKDCNNEQTFEDMLRSIGGFGWGTFRIYCLISLTDIFSSFSTISVVFIGATPNWSCTSFDHAHNRTVELPEGRCEANGTVSCENYHYGDDFTSIVTEWQLLCDKDYVSDLLTTVQMCGMAFGAFIFSQMSDVLRRKYSFYGAYCIQVTFALASAFSTSWQMYMVFRILVGVGFGGTMVVNIVYPLEFVTSRWRVLCGAMGFWPIGALIVPFVAYLVPDWKMLTIITSALGFLYAFTWPWLPESPRWLMQKGYYGEASDILSELSKQNGRSGSGPSPEKLEKILQNERKSEQKSDKKRYTFIDLVKNTHYLKQTAILAFTWFMSFLMYYFITFNMKNLSGNRYLNMVYAALADVLSQFIVMTTLNKSGRRCNLLAAMGTALLCMVGVLCLLMTGHDDSVYIMILCLVGKTATSTVTFVAGIYTAEVFPTAIRNIGVGVCSVMSRFGTLLAPMLAYLGLKFVLAPYIICGALTMVSTPLLFMLPETTGVSLRDTIPTSHKKPDGTKETEEDSLTIDNVEAQSLEMKKCTKL